MKVSEVKYERISAEEIDEVMKRLTAKVRKAASVKDILDAREEYVTLVKKFITASSLSYMRYTINTTDDFYIKEKDYYDEITPGVQDLQRDYACAMLESRFRGELEKDLNPLLFDLYEAQKRSVSPAILSDMVDENKLVTEYSQLMAALVFDFNGEKMPLSMLRKYMKDDERETRREAYETLGEKLSEESGRLDSLYGDLVRVRDKMAVKMGYKDFIELGYYRMNRISYDRKMVEAYRDGVVRGIVPAAKRLKESIAKSMGIDKFMLYDNDVSLPGGDPKPVLDKDGIFSEARKMYHDMGSEAGKFIDMMLENEAFDVDSRKNKWGGGYCISFPDYRQPFILANFNGTAADIDVITHEAGHALADYLTADNKFTYDLPYGMETAEVHSMSMEFFAWKYMDAFFGKDAEKYKFCHLADSLSFIPYGCAVDEFQHIVYGDPGLSPKQRKDVWNSLEAKYRPYLSTDEMPYLSEGTRWQYQMHIYETPFYYIDYCLAQTTALQFLAASRKDYAGAFERYIRFAKQGGEARFPDLIKEAGLLSPFEKGTLEKVARDTEDILKKLL